MFVDQQNQILWGVNMAQRISISPGDGLRRVPKPWRKKFAEESAEIIIRDGRYGEVLQKVSCLSPAILSGELLDGGMPNKPRKRIEKTTTDNAIVNSSNSEGFQEKLQVSAKEQAVAKPVPVYSTIAQPIAAGVGAPTVDNQPTLF